jgi:hypothetical protein
MRVFNVFNQGQVENMVDFISKLDFKDGKKTARGLAKDIKHDQHIIEGSHEAQKVRLNKGQMLVYPKECFTKSISSLLVNVYAFSVG